jgi:hypothetical protein
MILQPVAQEVQMLLVSFRTKRASGTGNLWSQRAHRANIHRVQRVIIVEGPTG